MQKHKFSLWPAALAVFLGVAITPSVVTRAAEPTAPTIDRTYSFGSGMGSSQPAAHKYIILHDVGTESTAWQNAHYFYNNWSTSQTYVQFVVGDGGHIYQLGAPGYQAWGAGSYANANAPVQIELGHTSDPVTFAKDYAAYVNLARYWAKAYGIGYSFDNPVNGKGILTHNYVSQHWWGDHTDPMAYLARFGITRAKLENDLAYGTASTIKVTTQTPAKAAGVNVTYATHELGGGWLSDVTNAGSGSQGYAGVPNRANDLLTVRVDHGSVRYRVHTAQSGWLGWVYKSNKADTVSGCAGVIGQAIDKVQVYYTTPSGETYRQAYYRSQTTKRVGWLPAVRDDTDYAGIAGEPMDRVQIKIGTSNPF